MTTDSRPARILIVDEEEPITHVLRIGLELEGWSVSVAHSGAAALADTSEPDVILLDMMLPDRLGTDVVEQLRAAGSRATVIFLTGRAEHDQRMAAFASGGDDYVTKPFSIEEVVDRVEAVVRRRGLARTSRRAGSLVLDVDARTAWVDDEFVALTSMEFELLRELVEHRGERRTRGELLMAAARRGIRVPVDLATTMLERLMAKVNRAGRAIVLSDSTGWMVA
jgi:two-component system OmpR family response regulator